MSHYDMVLIGHMAVDEVHHFGGEISIGVGSAVLCGALAAAQVGSKVAVITRMAEKDEKMLVSMRDAGIDVINIPSAETTYMQVIHPCADMDVRQIIQTQNAGFFLQEELPQFSADVCHLAGISNQEFEINFIKSLKKYGARLSADMQSFVRQVNKPSGEIQFLDVENKLEIIRLLDYVKMDIVEAEILTGTRDLEKAAQICADWGGGEVLITSSEGVLAFVNQEVFYSPFTNRSVIGRTGRGDTTFGAYLAWRSSHSVKEALDFAAALVSIKMESKGPFHGTLDDVLIRLNQNNRLR